MSEISKLKLSDDEIVDLKDRTARTSIDNINNSVGKANGIAQLNEQGYVPSDQLDTAYIVSTMSLSDTDFEEIFNED